MGQRDPGNRSLTLRVACPAAVAVMTLMGHELRQAWRSSRCSSEFMLLLLLMLLLQLLIDHLSFMNPLLVCVGQ